MTGETTIVSRPRWWQRAYASLVFYPTFAWNLFWSRVYPRRNWWDFIDDHVIVGARPLRRDVATLSSINVRAIVNTCEEFAGHTPEYERYGIEQLHIPTTDFCHPSIEDVTNAVAFTQRHVGEGNVVYIHCKAGRARSATVALCWLMQHRLMSAQQAQDHLLSARPHINSKLTQRPVVRAFGERLVPQPV